MNIHPEIEKEKYLIKSKNYWFFELFSINQQAGKLRILLLIAMYLVIWFFLSLAIFSIKPNSSGWLIHLLGSPKTLLVAIIYDFLANFFSLSLFILFILSVIIFRTSIILAGSFFSKLLNFPKIDIIEKHLTRCLFSTPGFPHIALDRNNFGNQNEKTFLSMIGGPAYLSSMGKSILVIEKGWKKPEILINVISNDKDYFLESKNRLVDFFPISNNTKFERLLGQSKDGLDIEIYDLEINYHFNVSKLKSLCNKPFPNLTAWFYFKDNHLIGFEACFRVFLQIIISTFIRTNPSTTYKTIIPHTDADSLNQAKPDRNKKAVHKHKNLYAHEHILIHWKRRWILRNRNLGIYPCLRKTESHTPISKSIEESFDEMLNQLKNHIAKSLEVIFGSKIVIIDSINLKGINYGNK